MPKVARILLVQCAIAAVIAGCTDSSAEQKGKSKQTAKSVKTEAVRQESVRRTLDVVGTLAAEDEVTVSSAGRRRRSPRARRSRRSVSQRGSRSSRSIARNSQYNLDQQKRRAGPRADEVRRGRSGPPAADRRHARRAEGGRRTGAGEAGLERASELHKRQLIPQQTLEDAETTLRLEAGRVRLRAAERKEPARRHRRLRPPREARRPSAARHLHPRTVRRVRAEAHGVARRAGQERRCR